MSVPEAQSKHWAVSTCGSTWCLFPFYTEIPNHGRLLKGTSDSGTEIKESGTEQLAVLGMLEQISRPYPPERILRQKGYISRNYHESNMNYELW